MRLCAVLAAVLFLGEHFSEVNAVGLCVLILGVVLFNVTKYRKMKRPTLERVSAKSPAGHGHSLGEMKRSASALGSAPLDGQAPVNAPPGCGYLPLPAAPPACLMPVAHGCQRSAGWFQLCCASR